MQQGLINKQNIAQNHGTQLSKNANSFIPKGQTSKTSFASELSKLQNANELIQHTNSGDELNQNLKQEAFNPDQEVSKFKDVLSQALANKGLDFDSLTPELKEKLAQMQDAVKQEVVKRQGQEESLKNAEDIQNKFSTNETAVANASQENQKQITDAVREGSVGEQEQAYDQSEERQQQLANWDDLAPRVIEDPKNRAVRIDIPGLPEIETVIVRMQGSKVSVQTVGDGKIMAKLQAREKELVSKLSSHNISLDTLKTFDSAALNKGKV